MVWNVFVSMLAPSLWRLGELLFVTELRKLDLTWPIRVSSHQSWLWTVPASLWEANDDSNEAPHRSSLCTALFDGMV